MDPISNNAGPECVNVCKIYDWTILSEDVNELVTIPEPCLEIIQTAISNDQEVTITCNSGLTPPPAFPACGTTNNQQTSCDATIIRRNVQVGNGSNAAVVRLYQAIPVQFDVFIGGSTTPSCTFTHTLITRTTTVLCLPEPLDQKNIFSRIANITCHNSGVLCNGDSINVDLTICNDVRVKTQVVLELVGKFCQPRLPIPVTAQDQYNLCVFCELEDLMR